MYIHNICITLKKMIMRWKNCSNNVGQLPAKSVTLIINNTRWRN